MRSTFSLSVAYTIQITLLVVKFRNSCGGACYRLLTDSHVGCLYHLAAQLLTVIV